jgi:signal recognition particle subunit SRP54
MTPQERKDHTILNASRKQRIARGSGTSVREVNQLLKDFVAMKQMMKKFQRFGLGKLRSMFMGQ